MSFLRKEPEPSQLPIPQPQPQRRPQRISEDAARAAQHVINLEEDNDHLRAENGLLRNRITFLDSVIADMKKAALELQAERDDYKHHYSHIYTSLQNAGAILVDCMRAPPRAERNGETDERIKSAVGNLEQQLIVDPPQQPGATEAGAVADAKAS